MKKLFAFVANSDTSTFCIDIKKGHQVSIRVFQTVIHSNMHVHMSPLGLGEVFDDGEMFEDDLEGDPVGEVFEDDPECDPVGDSVIIDSLESISST